MMIRGRNSLSMKQNMEKGKEEEENNNEAKLSTWKFANAGPVHLTCVDWRRPDHRRSIYASLTQGVYIMERDRQQKRMESDNALAPPWWKYFHFECINQFKDKIDSSIFGAVFQHKLRAPCYNQGVPSRYIVVFRGTIVEPETKTRDLYLDSQLVANGLPYDSRYLTAFRELQNLLNNVGLGNVVLVGHSLGAAIALEAGKDFAKRGCHIETYLFNPPCTSVPIEAMTDNHFVKDKARIVRSILSAGFHHVVKGNKGNKNITQQDEKFIFFCSWIPNLFVNPRDPICREYIGHFEHRKRMKELGLHKVNNIATNTSFMSMVSGSIGRESEPSYLLLSANLTKNMISNKEQSIKDAHCIEQWWQPHLNWDSKLYIYSEGLCEV